MSGEEEEESKAAGGLPASMQVNGEGVLRPGLRVRVHGLTSAAGRKMNGKIARVMANQDLPQAHLQEGRVSVKVIGGAGKPVAIKRSNLRTGDEACCALCGRAAGARGRTSWWIVWARARCLWPAGGDRQRRVGRSRTHQRQRSK